MSATPTTKTTPSRRQFLAGGALLGAGLLTGAPSAVAAAAPGRPGAIMRSGRPDEEYALGQAENMIYSSCLQCNTGCGIKAKIHDGVLSKIDGNPYSPWTMVPHLSYATHLADAAPVDGALCPKGQAGLQTAYDPYRLRKVLKRAGKRGEGEWQTIPFEQAVAEICEGGKLFAHVPGEEHREVEGLRAVAALTDPAVAAEMDKDVRAIWAEDDRDAKAALVRAFKERHAAHLDVLIDPDHPDLGPKNNQIVLNWGRVKGGRGDFYRRFAQSLGSVNAHGHTTVCQGSLYFTCQAISDQYRDGAFSGGKKFYWQADYKHSRFILFVGANLFEGNYGPPNQTVRLTENLASGRTRIAVADPRFNKLASKAWKWLPLQPGTDIPLAMAMIRWFFDEDAYNRPFLECANKAAAHARGEKSWSNATWLVKIEDGVPGGFVRARDLTVSAAPAPAPSPMEGDEGDEGGEAGGGEAEARPAARPLGEGHDVVVMVGGVPTAVDPNDPDVALFGDLFVDATLPDGTRVKSGLQILKESAGEHTVEAWSAKAECPARDVVAVARELARWAPASAVDIHRGPAQHTNGFYAVLAWMSLNMLLGSFDHEGGLVAPSTWDTMGRGGLFNLRSAPGAIKPFGVSSIRHGIDYEKTTLFEGYPARRNWYPLASDTYQEVIPSMREGYPYPVKILFLYMASPVYALPAGHALIDVLRDVEKLPLHVSNDIVVGTTTMYADYIFPDLSFLERWEFQGSHPNIPAKVQPVRQPVIAPIPQSCEVFGHTMPLSFEAMMLGMAERLGLPGFGADGFGDGLDFKHFDDLYLRAVANLAFGERPDGSQQVPDADDRELELFLRARRHLPSTVFDADRWRSIVGDAMWRKVVYVLNRGGRFQDFDACYRDGMLTNAFAGLLNLYQEKTAATIHAGTGERYAGYAREVPIQGFTGEGVAALREGQSFALITHRTISQCKSRTIANPWLTPLMPDNGVLINPGDAAAHGLREGQLVRVTSATNKAGTWPITPTQHRAMVGKLVFTQTMRPGVVSFALGFGHWATGASDIAIDGHVIRGEPRRTRGIHANAAMWTDPKLDDTCMFDPIGGSVSFYDTHVRLEPV